MFASLVVAKVAVKWVTDATEIVVLDIELFRHCYMRNGRLRNDCTRLVAEEISNQSEE